MYNKYVSKETKTEEYIMKKTTLFSKDFTLVAIGQIISIFGNQILRYALPLYLLNQTGSATLFGTIMAISFIPMLLLFPIGGIIADRVNKRNIMVILDFTTAALILLFYLMLGEIDIAPLITITMMFLYGIQGAYQPAVKASVPALVDSAHIMKANSIVDVINSVASMAGPVIGGILFSIIGLTPILIISIGCFFASAVMEIFIHIPFEKRKINKNIFSAGFDDLKISFNFIFKKQTVLWKISSIFASSNLLLTALVLIGLPILITGHLGFSEDTANRLYGYAQGVVALGAVIGGLLAGGLANKLKSKSGPVLLIGCSLCIFIIGIALQFLATPLAVYIVLITGCGLLLALHTLFQIQMVTYLQFLTPKDLIGKVISVFICVVMCTNPIGQFIYGIAFDIIGNSTYVLFYVSALIMIGISILTRHVFYGIDNLIKDKSIHI